MPGSDPQSHLPDELAAKLQAARAARAMQGERRVVTILFCDVADSTAIAEGLDPEDWAEIMNECFAHMIAPVYRYEGTVARLMGDAILAFFGAPIAHEDDPQRAVLAGLDIVAQVAPFRRKLKEARGIGLDVRVGIHTGEVVVGEIGTDFALEYTAMGDAVNLAARLEDAAAPGTVLISEETHRLVAPFFIFESLGGVPIRGRSTPTPTYRVVGRSLQPGSLRGIAGLRAPITGRDLELAALKAAAEKAKAGESQIVLLIGEAGLGKSRLLEELRPFWEQGARFNDTWVSAHGVSYDRDRPYGLLDHYFRERYSISREDTPEAMHAKIMAGLEGSASSANFEIIVHAFTELINPAAAADPSETANLSGEALKRKLFAGITEIFRHSLSLTPMAFVVDDLQWADPASVELLQHLLRLMDLGPALFICAMRPHEESPGWQIRESALQELPGRLTEIVLAPLSRRDSDELVKGLLRLPELPNELRRMIRRKAEGNPFFTEEIIRTLIDNGDLMQEKAGGRWVTTRQIDEIAIPDNVQALLAARMDRLQPATRRSLQAASVIGRTFSHELLERVVSLPEGSLELQVQEFQDAGLILGESHTSQRTYTFRHDLTRDAVFQSLLHRQRRELHRLVAEAIEELGADRLSEEASRLAYHFEQAGRGDKARHFHVVAGQEAARLYAQSEAITHFQRALGLAHESATVTGDQLTGIYLSLGRSLEMASRFKDALDLYHTMEVEARAQGDEGMALKALIHQGQVHSTPNVQFDFQKGEALAHEALALAERLDNPEAQARVYASMINLYRLSNRWPEGRKAGERAIALARELNEPELLAFCLNDLAHVYMSSVDPRQAHVLLDEASGLWQQLGNQPMLADTYATMALTDYIMADFEGVLAHSAAAYQISQVIDNPWGQSYSLLMIGDVYWERGLVGQAIASMEESIALAERAGFLVPQVENRAFLGLMYGYLGDFERGLALAHQAVELGERSGAPYLKPASGFLAELYVVKGDLQAAKELLGPIGELVLADPVISTFAYSAQSRLQLALGNYQEALALADNLLNTLKPMGVRVFLPKILFHRGEALIALGRPDAARESLDRARQEAEVMDAQAILWLILGTQAALEGQAGDNEKAEALRGQAREIIHFIADQIPEPGLRDSFLGMDNVRPLLGGG